MSKRLVRRAGLVLLGVSLLIPSVQVQLGRLFSWSAEPGRIATPGHAGLDCAHCHQGWGGLERQLNHQAAGRSMEHSCLACHSGYALHRAEVKGTASCLACHGEHHQGVVHRVTEHSCVSCHADSSRVKVPSWARHPEIKAVLASKDPAGLVFSHAGHLRPEHKLECASCHTPSVRGGRMLPVRYIQHCARCHHLEVPVAGKVLPVLHLDPETARAVFRQQLIELAGIQQPPVRDDLWKPGQPIPDPRDQGAWLQRRMAEFQRIMFFHSGGCRLCHTSAKMEVFKPLLTNLVDSWMPAAQFSHTAHRQLSCLACHGQVARSQRAAELSLPSIKRCQECHGREAYPAAKSSCQECHTYHGAGRDR